MSNNVAVNAVSSYMHHYKRKGIKVKSIKLTPAYWHLFSEYVKRTHEDFKFQDAIELNDVTIMKGSKFQVQNVEVELA